MSHPPEGHDTTRPSMVPAFRSRQMREVCELAARVAVGNAKVLITGESRVGKEVLANYIHRCSPRAQQRFVAINCAALSEPLLETELFGHFRGSSANASRDEAGRPQVADLGTIFLDEIGEMGLRVQALLQRFLENGEIQPIGTELVNAHAGVRLLSATSRRLSELVEQGTFRLDLLYRINVVHIEIPPLRDRPEDIRPLVEALLARAGRPLTFTAETMAALEQYRWPGNVRELQNVIERLAWTTTRSTVELHDLEESLRNDGGTASASVGDRDRRAQVDDLFAALGDGRLRFWKDVHVRFLNRDLTRDDIRDLVRRGLAASGGSYRGLLAQFGLPERDYKRLLNFLRAHGCTVDFRAFRTGSTPPNTEPGEGDRPDDPRRRD
jgi:transcriptional regulator with GAF, ATPase, and Fis domain